MPIDFQVLKDTIVESICLMGFTITYDASYLDIEAFYPFED